MPGKKVVLINPISGRFRAGARNAFRFLARNSTSWPERSSRAIVNPPDVATPGMAGGEKLKAMPSGSVLRLLVQACLDPLKLLRWRPTIVSGLEGDKEESVVAGAHETEQTKADHAGG